MGHDSVVAKDRVEAGLAEYVPPSHPCPECGRETVRHTPGAKGEKQRICTSTSCRHIQVTDGR